MTWKNSTSSTNTPPSSALLEACGIGFSAPASSKATAKTSTSKTVARNGISVGIRDAPCRRTQCKRTVMTVGEVWRVWVQ
eukprot:CAMPEP_0171070034 /NCGR_PEP_ID=MMETSP0766_2-20121228/9502_1 /TAXON_ID=439317 /ORGANISM="Gambierdiscus australes, Strain CAWD 149" /LENGTH=79 /DNA_ID=CAMNT_0011526459 /DNA_START=599 /DNA_END=838 /DNA_ORIENTATION=-